MNSKKGRRYAAATVIAAQRRVLGMVASQISQMPPRQLDRLRLDRGTGTTTWREIQTHVTAASGLQVKP